MRAEAASGVTVKEARSQETPTLHGGLIDADLGRELWVIERHVAHDVRVVEFARWTLENGGLVAQAPRIVAACLVARSRKEPD